VHIKQFKIVVVSSATLAKAVNVLLRQTQLEAELRTQKHFVDRLISISSAFL
jgi:hypothetical protein